MKINKILLPIILLGIGITAKAQDLTEANELYKEGSYSAAVPFYEEVVKTRPSAAVKSKLANCYRIMGRNAKAAELYNDITRDDIALPIDIQHYGEVLISLGKYDSAKVYLKKYGELFPDDKQNQNLLSICDNAKSIKTAGNESIISVFSQNTKLNERVVAFVRKGIVFVSDRPSGGFSKSKPKSKAKGEEFGFWYTEKQVDDTYGEPARFSKKLDGITENGGNACLTADLKTVYYSRLSEETNKRGKNKFQIYSATSEDGERWRNDAPLPFCSIEEDYYNPSISPDGKRLYFAAERADAVGEGDIYYVERKDDGSWSKPKNLGKILNTVLDENYPVATADGKLYFCSKGHTGFGGFDIFVTEQNANGEWKTPVNLGTPINSPYDDFSIIFSDETHGAFNSARAGKNHDVYFFEWKKSTEGNKPQEDTPSVVEAQNKNEDKKIQPETVKKNEIIVASVKKEVENKIAADDKKAQLQAEDKKNESKIGNNKKEESDVKKDITENLKIEEDQPAKEAKSDVDKTTNATKEENNQEESAGQQKKSFVDEMSKMLATGRLKKNKKVVADALYFKNMYEIEISDEVGAELKRLAEFMNQNGELNIEIGAYTEVEGDSKKFKQIAQRRAEKIVEYLISLGVKEKRISAKGYGARKPIKDCREGGCKEGDDEKNRRIEIKIKS
jgi:outer membrane protein OmpA-like peptidoglycan-associated protein/tetratricopeptide (TPR) repeat protein